MIDRRKSDYKDYNWKFMTIDENHNGFQYTDGLNVSSDNLNGDKMVFSNGNYIFNNFHESHVFIRQVEVPIGAHVSPSSSYDHSYESNKLILEKRLDLRNPDTWDILWDNYVDIMSFKEKILYVISKDGWLKSLIWVIDKIKQIQPGDSVTVVENVLRGSISNNNVDIVEYISKEYPEIIKTLGSNPNIMSAIAELAISPNKQPDYCFPTMKSIINNGLFDEVNANIVLSPCAIMLKTMKHDDTYRLMQSYINKK